MTGVLQAHARAHHIPINTLEFTFKHAHQFTQPAAPVARDHREYSSDAVTITGLFLEGAAWDATVGALTESLPGILYSVWSFASLLLLFSPCLSQSLHKASLCVFESVYVCALPLLVVLCCSSEATMISALFQRHTSKTLFCFLVSVPRLRIV